MDIGQLSIDDWQMCPFSSAKKWHFKRPNLRTDSKNLAEHPPQFGGVDILLLPGLCHSPPPSFPDKIRKVVFDLAPYYRRT